MTIDPEELKAADAEPLNETCVTVKDLSDSLAMLLNDKDRKEKELSALEKRIQAVNTALLELMQEAQITSFKSAAGTFYIRNNFRAGISDPDPAFAFLRARGLEGLIKQTVHHKTLSSDIKRMVMAGEVDLFSLEQQGIKAFIDTKVSVLGRDKTK